MGVRLATQPIISLEDGVLVGAEALVRWNHPERGMLGPGEFISVVEESGLITSIGAWVLEEGCRRAQEWRMLGRYIHISVNVSPVQLLLDDVLARVEAALEETGLPAPLLHLEVTESSLIEDADTIAPVLQSLRASGSRSRSATSAAARRRSATSACSRWTS